MSLLDKGKQFFEELESQVSEESASSLSNVFGFISLNNGAGASTLLSQVDYLLRKQGKRVCLLDANFFQPNLCSMYNVKVTPKRSIINYIYDSLALRDYFLPVPGQPDCWLVSASLSDDIKRILDVPVDFLVELMVQLGNRFDYVLVDLNYNPALANFLYPVMALDKGFIVWDDQPDCPQKTSQLLRFVHKTTADRAGVINNVILNKRSSWAFPYPVITDAKCNLVAELPYLPKIELCKIKGENPLEKGILPERYLDELDKIVASMLAD